MVQKGKSSFYSPASMTSSTSIHPTEIASPTGHSDVAPLRKQDPGELFDWSGLAQAGIGFWPDFAVTIGKNPVSLTEIQGLLTEIGYSCPQTGGSDVETTAVLAAFQRHYRPECVDGNADAETRRRIAVLAQALQSA